MPVAVPLFCRLNLERAGLELPHLPQSLEHRRKTGFILASDRLLHHSPEDRHKKVPETCKNLAISHQAILQATASRLLRKSAA